jgi:hypothetical protein
MKFEIVVIGIMGKHHKEKETDVESEICQLSQNNQLNEQKDTVEKVQKDEEYMSKKSNYV